MKNIWLLCAFLPCLAQSHPWWLKGSVANENEFLDPDQAFRVSSYVDGRLIRVRWTIADGYYLYRTRFNITAESPDLIIDAPVYPRGIAKTDPYLGTQEIFEHEIEAIVAFNRIDGGAHPLQIKVAYQGCAAAGLCYPQITKILMPVSAPSASQPPPAIPAPASWVAIPILGGSFAFFCAGWMLRRKNASNALD